MNLTDRIEAHTGQKMNLSNRERMQINSNYERLENELARIKQDVSKIFDGHKAYDDSTHRLHRIPE